MMGDNRGVSTSPLVFAITLCGTIIPPAFKLGAPREKSLFGAVLTSNENFCLPEDLFPCVYVPGSAGIGARIFQGHILDDKVQGDGMFLGGGHFLLADAVVHGSVMNCPEQNPGNVFVQELADCAGEFQVLSFGGHLFQGDVKAIRDI